MLYNIQEVVFDVGNIMNGVKLTPYDLTGLV